MSTVTEATLRADLSFLSSDALQGRDTPSPGLDVAAEFIASRFRLAGLEAPVNDSYFQIADLTEGAKRVAEHHKRPGPTHPVVGRNVIGILRGSDPELSKTYVIVSAHYDHIGTADTVDGRTPEKNKPGAASADRIYNGADDDGSGTVSVIALAEAFARLKIRPKRSIIFMTFCGEELGLLGSNFYAQHPVVPLKQTIAEINLEQIGRTDGDLKKGTASLTGFTYTSLGALFERAGLTYGMKMVTLPGTENYFNASDNLNFAKAGIPDTTICTAFEFPDYHGLHDEWPKIDFAALLTMNRIAATVLWTVANANTVPVWNSSLKQTERFRAAARETYGREVSGPLTPEPEPSTGVPVTK
jgi:Zn-dependent M28 family amino/carboxypeptidase